MPIPPKRVQDTARRALEIRASLPPSRRAGTPVGIARARDIANGVNLSEETLRRMVAFFARHEKNYDPSDVEKKGTQAWLLWGGTSGRRWAEAQLRRIENQRD